MLVLTREEGQDVLIRVPGVKNAIRVRVVSIRGNKIRLGFVAGKEITIDRDEIDDQKRALEEATFAAQTTT